jgi:hypothetical protein
MSMSQPMEPSLPPRGGIPAADPGLGGPEPAEGFGVEGEEPDVTHAPAPAETAIDDAMADENRGDTPFRTPDPREVGRARSN